MPAVGDYYGYIHLKDIVKTKIVGFREVSYDDHTERQVNLVTRVNGRIVSDRWYSETDESKVTVDLRLEV